MSSGVFMVIDLDRCWGCRTCEVACKQELGLGVGPRPMNVLETGARMIDGVLHRDFVPTSNSENSENSEDQIIKISEYQTIWYSEYSECSEN